MIKGSFKKLFNRYAVKYLFRAVFSTILYRLRRKIPFESDLFACFAPEKSLIPADRWLEIDLYWFDKNDLQHSVETAILPHIGMHITAMVHGRETTGQVPPHYSSNIVNP